MTFYLASGGKITVKGNGTVEFRENGRVMRDAGRGSYLASVEWIRSRAFGSDVRHVRA